MKKTIMFLGMLAVGFANAQQGNVGINTDQPKATLEIKPTATNLAGTTNEGIVAPKLSKTRVAAINEPMEGTLVYVTDEATSTIASYTENDVKVAKIDEKGYYFFDGKEWVKTSNEWIYQSDKNRIYLKRSGDTNGTFKNKIFYDVTTGQFIDTDAEDNIRGVQFVNSNRNLSFKEITESLADMKFKNYTYAESANLQASGNIKKIEHRDLIVSETDKTPNYFLEQSSLSILPSNMNNYVSIYASNANANLFGTGEVINSIGQSGQINISNTQSIKGFITGILGTNAINTSGSIGEVYGVLGRNFFYSPVGADVTKSAGGYFSNSMPLNDNSLIQEFSGIQINVSNNSQNVETGKYIAGVYSIANQVGKTKYPNLYGIYTSSSVATTATAPDNHYGLYIRGINGAKQANYGIYVGNVGEQTPNRTILDYAIYTNGGKVHFGDVVEIKKTIKVGNDVSNDTCNGTNAGIIRFKNNKFQGCTGTEWKDLHN